MPAVLFSLMPYSQTPCQGGISFIPFADKENRIQKKGNLLFKVTWGIKRQSQNMSSSSTLKGLIYDLEVSPLMTYSLGKVVSPTTPKACCGNNIPLS